MEREPKGDRRLVVATGTYCPESLIDKAVAMNEQTRAVVARDVAVAIDSLIAEAPEGHLLSHIDFQYVAAAPDLI